MEESCVVDNDVALLEIEKDHRAAPTIRSFDISSVEVLIILILTSPLHDSGDIEFACCLPFGSTSM